MHVSSVQCDRAAAADHVMSCPVLLMGLHLLRPCQKLAGSPALHFCLTFRGKV